MGYEIERKFLVADDRWRQAAGAGETLRQGYLAGGVHGSVRVRASGGSAWLNIKGATVGATRREFEYPIPLADAAILLDELCQRPLIEKTRYLVGHAGFTWEIDVFAGDNAGLVVAEIELEHADATFPHPEWLGIEVTEQPRYYNVSLVEHPYRNWSDAERAGHAASAG
ncbi:MAG TPA: CYTH domain-containing protein [Gammaproteobacteria bacterium]